MVAPVGKVYQAGTLSGNPLAMRAGFTLLSMLHATPAIYQNLESVGAKLEQGLFHCFREKSIPVCINRVGSMISLHFSDQKVTNFNSASAARNDLFNRYFHHCLGRGIYLPPSAFESWFLCHALQQADIDLTLEATREFLANL